MAFSARVPFLHSVGAGLTVGEQDLSKFVCLEEPQALGVPENLKGHIGHEGHRPTLILGDPQAGQLLVDDGGGGFLPCYHADRLNGIGHGLPSLDARQLPNLPAAGGQLVKDDHAVSGLARPGLPGLNVLDLDGNTGESVAGVAPLFHPEGAVGGVPEGQSSGFVILHIRVLGALIRQKMIAGRFLLGYGIVALKGQGDYHSPIRPCGEGANLFPFRVIHGENSPLQGNFRALLQFDDLQGCLIRVGDAVVRITAHSGQIQPYIIVQIADIVLQVAVFVLLLAYGIHSGILGHRSGQGELDVPALARYAVSGVEHLELSGVAIPGGLGGDSGDLVVVHIHDFCACGHAGRIGKIHRYIVVIYPCLAPNGEHLLLIFLAVDGHGIGHGGLRRGGHPGLQHIVIGGAPLIDVLGRGQDAVADVQLCAGEAGGYFKIGDIPVGKQIAPEGHLGGIVGLVLVIQPQLS